MSENGTSHATLTRLATMMDEELLIHTAGALEFLGFASGHAGDDRQWVEQAHGPGSAQGSRRGGGRV